MVARSYETPIIVSLVFSIIAAIVSLGSVFGSCLIRRPTHNPKAIPFKSLFILLLSQTIHIAFTIYSLLNLGDAPPETAEAMKIIPQICKYLQSILILNVLYRLIHAYQAQNRNDITKTILPSQMHGSTLVSLVIISIPHFITWLLSQLGYDTDYQHSTYGLQLAFDGIVTIASLHISFKIFTIIQKLNNARRFSMNGASSLAVGWFFFFTHSLSLLIGDSKGQGTAMTDNMNYEEIVPFICITGQSIGIVHCCMQVHKLGIYGLFRPSSANDERAHILTGSNEEML
ncbi:hypothetical protein BO85DRAFT_175449 [Aspergillus piperis CBS 112811]|uniref:Uncharacterized protein n=1 Tax=Aspergillus piperis CBS 112811 TaxID=1448313 RepID=A0A8G1QS91_9EURO|nr:hypothetical protein BO85DRAFT_175449 [Aspergillus piperis CBS 112811]RAH52637.1 hypothetical protein BO85DRAFT_175449 [Aspergillus piperis CBS 112811]